jgi:hypothetical protein
MEWIDRVIIELLQDIACEGREFNRQEVREFRLRSDMTAWYAGASLAQLSEDPDCIERVFSDLLECDVNFSELEGREVDRSYVVSKDQFLEIVDKNRKFTNGTIVIAA